MADDVEKAKGPAEKFTGQAVVVEVGDFRNRNLVWGPTKHLLRGRWAKANLRGDELTQEIALMPDLPGMCIAVDPRRRTLKIFDPLSLPANADLLAKAKKAHKEIFRDERGPERPFEVKDAKDTDVKTWLHLIRELLDQRNGETGQPEPFAREVDGRCPTAEEIDRMPGKTRMAFHDSSASVKVIRFQEDQERVEE